MNENLRKYVDDLFASAPQNKKTLELKEELLINMNEKYGDLIHEGYSEDEAYKLVISKVGDIDELIGEIQPSPLDPVEIEQRRRKTALVVSVCVGMYIFALLLEVLIDALTWYPDDYSGIVFLGISAVATCILIYHFMSRPKYNRMEDTVVEEYKEKVSKNQKKKDLLGALSSVLWTFIVCIYFIVSFTFMNWHVSWIVFFIGVALQHIIRLCVDLFPLSTSTVGLSQKSKRIRNSIISFTWSIILLLYFVMSFLLMNWAVSWILFLFGAAITTVINLIFQIRSNNGKA